MRLAAAPAHHRDDDRQKHQPEGHQVVDSQFLLPRHQNGEEREDDQRDRLLDDFELREGERPAVADVTQPVSSRCCL